MKKLLLLLVLCTDPMFAESTKPLTVEQRVAVLEIENKLLRHEINHIHNEDIAVINQWIKYLFTCFRQIWGQVPQVMPERDKRGDRF